MFLFLIPMGLGFACNWASAFTHFFSGRLGERAGRRASFVLRNILGIPVWVAGLVMAYRRPAAFLYTPPAALEIFSWLLLLIGTAPMLWALRRLGRRSYRPTGQDTLVSSGIYRFIRHPIYNGLLVDFAALVLRRPTWPAIVACVLGCGYVYIQARLEEIDLLQRVSGYLAYMEHVPRFFPRLGKTRTRS